MQWDVTKTFFIVFIVCVSSKSVNSMKTGVWWRGGAGAHFVLCCTPGTSNCAEHLINNLYAGKHKLMNLN